MWHSVSNRAKNRAISVLLAVLLVALNVYVCRELFRLEYTRHMGSIEAAFISLARYISQNWSDLTWFPLWYGGIPFQDSYPPVLHATVAGVSSLSGTSAARAYHVVTAALYCLAPVTLYWLALRLSGSVGYSFFAGLLYTALSPSAFLVPQIRNDMGTVFGARRFETLVFYGECPHLTGIVLIPVAIVCLHALIQRRTGWLMASTAGVFALTALSNWLAAFALAAAVVAYLLAQLPEGRGSEWPRGIGIAAAAGILAYALAAPWVPPSTIRVIEMNAKTIGGDYTRIYRNLPLQGALVVAGLLLIVWILRRLRARMVVRFSAVFAYFMSALVLPAAWWGAALMPQPDRYHLEMEMGICLLLPFAFRPLIARIPGRGRAALVGILVLATIFPMKRERRHARYYLSGIDVAKTVEYRMATWFEAHWNGGRVLVPGTISYWMNTWTDTPQLGGGFDQGVSNPMIRLVQYVVYSDDGVAPGRRLETTLLWLQAFGVQAVAGQEPNSREVYKPYLHADKYGSLHELWRDSGDVVYAVPQRSASLARIVRTADIPLRKPVNGLDLDPVRSYVAALNDPSLPVAHFQWLNRHEAAIAADLRPGQAVSLQMTWHPGWHARVNGAPRPLREDALGQMYLEPGCDGRCSVQLTYDGGLEMQVTRTLQIAGILVSAVLVGVPRRRRRSLPG
jgi:hypothetical protein